MVSLIVIATTSLFLPVRHMSLEGIVLCAGSANATLEVFEGTIGTIATIAIGAGGSGYTALDVLTLVQAGSGEQATVRVDTVDGSGAITGVTLLTGGTGYDAGSTYAVTGGTGTSGTITASTITDSGTSILKIASLANTALNHFGHQNGVLVKEGLSVRISGTGAQGYVIYS